MSCPAMSIASTRLEHLIQSMAPPWCTGGVLRASSKQNENIQKSSNIGVTSNIVTIHHTGGSSKFYD
jgi:hypothetical protein